MPNPISEQYREVLVRIMAEADSFMDAQNVISLIPEQNIIVVEERLVMKVIMRYLKDVGRASLSKAGWDPKRVKAEMGIISMWKYSPGIEYPLSWEDFETLIELEGNIYQMGLDKIFKQPAITAGCYWITGKELKDDNSYGTPPYTDQYNFVMDAGESNGELKRPLIAFSAAGGSWAITASEAGVKTMMAKLDALVDTTVSKGYRKETSIIIYPEIAETAMGSNKTTGGDGIWNAFTYLEKEKGIPRARIIKLEDLYIPRATASHAAPTAAAFDIYMIDLMQIIMIIIEQLKSNIYFKNPDSMHPDVMAEANYQFLPLFRANYRKAEGKTYKGVGRLVEIDGSSTS